MADPDNTQPNAGDDSPKSNRNILLAAGVATGIGSAALVAALLYANRDKRKGPKEVKPTATPESTD